MTLLFLNLGGGEVVVILLVILLFFGSKSIPSLAKGLGRGIREFKEAADGIKREIEESAKPMADQMHIDMDEPSVIVQQPKQAENQPISPAEKSVDEIIAETKSRDTAEKKVGE